MSIKTNVTEIKNGVFKSKLLGTFNENAWMLSTALPICKLRWINAPDAEQLHHQIVEALGGKECRLALGHKTGRMYFLTPKAEEVVYSTSPVVDIVEEPADSGNWAITTSSGHTYFISKAK